MTLHTRLRRLEERAPDPGCQGCSDRHGRIEFVKADRLADESVVFRGTKPEACGLCGVVPEDVVTVIHPYVKEPDRNDEVQHGNKERP
jgi:hypothetical protein